jgi:hypothetical protein
MLTSSWDNYIQFLILTLLVLDVLMGVEEKYAKCEKIE